MAKVTDYDYARIGEALKKKGVPFILDDFVYRGEKKDLKGKITKAEWTMEVVDSSGFCSKVFLPVRVMPERYEEVAQFLVTCNRELKHGRFDLDGATGQIFFYSFLAFEELRNDFDRAIENALFFPCREIEAVSDVLVQMNEGKISAKDACGAENLKRAVAVAGKDASSEVVSGLQDYFSKQNDTFAFDSGVRCFRKCREMPNGVKVSIALKVESDGAVACLTPATAIESSARAKMALIFLRLNIMQRRGGFVMSQEDGSWALRMFLAAEELKGNIATAMRIAVTQAFAFLGVLYDQIMDSAVGIAATRRLKEKIHSGKIVGVMGAFDSLPGDACRNVDKPVILHEILAGSFPPADCFRMIVRLYDLRDESDECPSSNEAALACALKTNNISLIFYLLSYFVDGHLGEKERIAVALKSFRMSNEGTLLHAAVEYTDMGAVADFLISCGLDVNAVNQMGRTPLHLAVKRGMGSAVGLLLRSGADVHIRDKIGKTPFDEAVDLGDTGVKVAFKQWMDEKNEKGESFLTKEDMEEQTPLALQYLQSAKSTRNKSEIAESSECGCFYCLQRFSAKEIEEWADNGETALCPKCGCESVLGDASVPELTERLLEKMRQQFFNE